MFLFTCIILLTLLGFHSRKGDKCIILLLPRATPDCTWLKPTGAVPSVLEILMLDPYTCFKGPQRSGRKMPLENLKQRHWSHWGNLSFQAGVLELERRWGDLADTEELPATSTWTQQRPTQPDRETARSTDTEGLLNRTVTVPSALNNNSHFYARGRMERSPRGIV